MARQAFADPAEESPGVLQVFQGVTEDPAVSPDLADEELFIGLLDIQGQDTIAVPPRQVRELRINVDTKVIAGRIRLLEFASQRTRTAADLYQAAA
jgi:hypothetical protein